MMALLKMANPCDGRINLHIIIVKLSVTCRDYSLYFLYKLDCGSGGLLLLPHRSVNLLHLKYGCPIVLCKIAVKLFLASSEASMLFTTYVNYED